MAARMDFRKASPPAAKAIADLHAYVHRCGLEHGLLELVKLRASQLNGCAHCIDMHTKELRADGVPGCTVASASDESPQVAAAADLVVAGPDEIVALLAAIAGRLRQ